MTTGRVAPRTGRGRALGALLAALALLALNAAPARATAYRYWSFWERTGGSWRFAPTGPASATPSDGDVEGWRFAVGADSAKAAGPRGPVSFARACAGTPAVGGDERIAVVLDFGTVADAPDGSRPPRERTGCARVPRGASAADALAAVGGPLRYGSSGLVCGISGYPAAGCGEAVGAARHAVSAPAASGHGGPSAGLYAGLGVAVAVGGAAAWRARRRRG